MTKPIRNIMVIIGNTTTNRLFRYLQLGKCVRYALTFLGKQQLTNSKVRKPITITFQRGFPQRFILWGKSTSKNFFFRLSWNKVETCTIIIIRRIISIMIIIISTYIRDDDQLQADTQISTVNNNSYICNQKYENEQDLIN